MGASTRRGRRSRVGALAVFSVAVLLTLGPATASAATLTAAWGAKIGSAGVNGSATISALMGGTGTLSLKLAKLKASTSLPVVLSKGTCSSVGSTLIALPAIKTSSSGGASRTTSLTAAQVTLVTTATAGTGKVAIRVGSSATGGVRCGLFAALAVPPYLAATITVGRGALGVAVAPNGILVENGADHTLSRVDPVTNNVLAVIPLTITGIEAPVTMTVGQGAVWIVVDAFDTAGNYLPGSVERLDPVTDAVIATIPVGVLPFGITTSPGAVWVANYQDGTVSRIDPATNQVASTITLAAGVFGLAFDFGSLWVANEQTGSVTRIDPATNMAIAAIPTVGSAESLASAGGAIWVANSGTQGQSDGVVSRIDPATNQVTTTIPVGTNPLFMASGGGSLWIGPSGDATVVEVNPATSTVTRIPTGSTALDSNGQVVGLAGIVATDHAVWATQDLPAADTTSAPPASTLYRVNYSAGGSLGLVASVPPAPVQVPSLANVTVGQCFTDVLAKNDPTNVLGELIVPCKQPHQNEMFATATYAAAPGAPFPAGTTLDDYANQLCKTAFQQYVGIPASSSMLGWAYTTPSASSWPYGDRWIGCWVESTPPAAPLVGSVRGIKQ